MHSHAKNKIVIDEGVNIWPHELHTASVFTSNGFDVNFVPAHNSFRSADAYINGVLFEFKAPEGNSIRSVERNLLKALKHQSNNIVIDSVRIKKIKDKSIQSYLKNNYRRFPGIRKLYFVTRHGELIDIQKLL